MVNRGAVTEAHIVTAFLDANVQVSVPWGDHCRYDFIADAGGRLWRVQAKTATLRYGGISFQAATKGWDQRKKGLRRLYVEGEVDLFACWCPNAAEHICVIESAGMPIEPTFRIVPARNAQREKIRWAVDFTIAAWLGRITVDSSGDV